MDTYMATITAAPMTPLLMHNGRLSNPMDPYTKRLKELTGARTKTDETHAAIMRAEFEGGLYWDEDLGPYLPAEMVEAGIKEGGRVSKNGKKIEAGVFIMESRVRLDYEGPRSIDGLYPKFSKVSGVRVQKNRVIRTRPCFHNWSATFTLQAVPDLVNEEDIIRAIEDAGRVKGIGDWRPRCGRFVLKGWTK